MQFFVAAIFGASTAFAATSSVTYAVKFDANAAAECKCDTTVKTAADFAKCLKPLTKCNWTLTGTLADSSVNPITAQGKCDHTQGTTKPNYDMFSLPVDFTEAATITAAIDGVVVTVDNSKLSLSGGGITAASRAACQITGFKEVKDTSAACPTDADAAKFADLGTITLTGATYAAAAPVKIGAATQGFLISMAAPADCVATGALKAPTLKGAYTTTYTYKAGTPTATTTAAATTTTKATTESAAGTLALGTAAVVLVGLSLNA